MIIKKTALGIVLALILLTLAIGALLLAPVATRQALEEAIQLWWNHVVPILLPGYVLAQAVQALLPRRPGWSLLILSLLTFPPVSAVVLYDWLRMTGTSGRRGIPLLLYTNLYNPLLFPHPALILRLDGALCLAALMLAPPWRLPNWTLPPLPLRPRQWILDGMNWTTILGLVVTVAWVLHQWWPHWSLGWLIDPVLIHWGARPKLSPATWFWTALGGLLWWIPLTLKYGPQTLTKNLLTARIMQAALATLLLLLIPL